MNLASLALIWRMVAGGVVSQHSVCVLFLRNTCIDAIVGQMKSMNDVNFKQKDQN